MPKVFCSTPPEKAQLRAPLSPLQTAWTGKGQTRVIYYFSVHNGVVLPDIWLRWRGCCTATLLATLSFGLAKAYANHPWSVTEPEAVGVPGWQTGTKALCLYRLLTVATQSMHGHHIYSGRLWQPRNVLLLRGSMQKYCHNNVMALPWSS